MNTDTLTPKNSEMTLPHLFVAMCALFPEGEPQEMADASNEIRSALSHLPLHLAVQAAMLFVMVEIGIKSDEIGEKTS